MKIGDKIRLDEKTTGKLIEEKEIGGQPGFTLEIEGGKKYIWVTTQTLSKKGVINGKNN